MKFFKKGPKLIYFFSYLIWIITFLMLIALIIVASLDGVITDKVIYANSVAGCVLAFAIILIFAILFIVGIKYHENKKFGRR